MMIDGEDGLHLIGKKLGRSHIDVLFIVIDYQPSIILVNSPRRRRGRDRRRSPSPPTKQEEFTIFLTSFKW